MDFWEPLVIEQRLLDHHQLMGAVGRGFSEKLNVPQGYAPK